ncbi:hypothetical protein B0T16DRAFT_449508 [Cercophora newfieldiana]|uniref:Uncharacterized protein n=1 Tax=Cercophora newfieldiana TaxID=92897 RepID=A0AA40CH02_9PEZI|nr:hypothetical protein B0T16DRAFT_449508 [Cercophora newfieldiana]
MPSKYRPIRIRQTAPHYLAEFDVTEFLKKHKPVPQPEAYHADHSVMYSLAQAIPWMIGILIVKFILRYLMACFAQIQHRWPQFTPLDPDVYWPFKIDPVVESVMEEGSEEDDSEEDDSEEDDSDEDDSEEEQGLGDEYWEGVDSEDEDSEDEDSEEDSDEEQSDWWAPTPIKHRETWSQRQMPWAQAEYSGIGYSGI